MNDTGTTIIKQLPGDDEEEEATGTMIIHTPGPAKDETWDHYKKAIEASKERDDREPDFD